MLLWGLQEKIYGPFLWIEFKCLKASEPLSRDNALLTTKIPGFPGTHFLTSAGLKAELALKLPSGLEPGVPGRFLWSISKCWENYSGEKYFVTPRSS